MANNGAEYNLYSVRLSFHHYVAQFLWIGTNVGLYFGFHFKFELGINYYILRKVLFVSTLSSCLR